MLCSRRVHSAPISSAKHTHVGVLQLRHTTCDCQVMGVIFHRIQQPKAFRCLLWLQQSPRRSISAEPRVGSKHAVGQLIRHSLCVRTIWLQPTCDKPKKTIEARHHLRVSYSTGSVRRHSTIAAVFTLALKRSLCCRFQRR
jgi:hypothetical protein